MIITKPGSLDDQEEEDTMIHDLTPAGSCMFDVASSARYERVAISVLVLLP
jgi:hypothetical protein